MRKWALVGILVVLPVAVLAITVEGKSFPATMTVEGKSLKIVGAGLREKWFFDVYAMGAYSESGKCNPQAIINDDEAKVLRLEMLRDVSAEKMASTIGESFEEHMPKNAAAELRQQSKTFQRYFKDECKENTVLEFIYLPGTGTVLKQNGKRLGPPLTGQAFQKVLWDIYFGKDTCCDDLKEEILESCKKK